MKWIEVIKWALLGAGLTLILFIVMDIMRNKSGEYVEVRGIKFFVKSTENKEVVIKTMDLLLGAKETLFKHLLVEFDPKNKSKIIYLENETVPLFAKIKRMVSNFKPEDIKEVIPGNILGDTSYVINKGEEMGFCMKNTPDSEIHEQNILLFVFVHELAHCMTKTYGHPPIFWRNMSFLLEQAENIKLLENKNYYRTPEYYCSMKVSHNPLYI
jgi:hypothetical protein